MQIGEIVRAMSISALAAFLIDSAPIDNSALAQTDSHIEVFAESVYNLDANAALWNATQEITWAKIGDLAGHLGLNDTLLGRLGVVALGHEAAAMLAGLSHEAGHVAGYRKLDPEAKLSLRLPFGIYYNLALLPLMIHDTDVLFLPKAEEAFYYTSGFNANELDASLLTQKTPFNMDVGSAIAHLNSKLFDQMYQIGEAANGANGDVWAYQTILQKNGIAMSKGNYLLQSVIADFLSFRTWEALDTVWNFVANGTQERASGIQVGGGLISWPNVAHYLTMDGSLYDVSIVGQTPDGDQLHLSVASDLICPGDSKLDALRVEVGNATEIGGVEVAANVAFNFSPNSAHNGYSGSLRVRVPVLRNIGLVVSVEYAERDLIQNTVKGQEAQFIPELGFWASF